MPQSDSLARRLSLPGDVVTAGLLATVTTVVSIATGVRPPGSLDASIGAPRRSSAPTHFCTGWYIVWRLTIDDVYARGCAALSSTGTAPDRHILRPVHADGPSGPTTERLDITQPSRTNGRFTDQVAIVTGGGSGIGAATAHRLADEGARVIIVGRREDKLAETVAAHTGNTGTIVAHVADVTDEHHAAAAIEFAASSFGRLDIVVNCASRNEYGTIADTTTEAWRSSFAVNVDGALFFARAAAPHLTATRGSIVNVGSDSAFGADPQHAAYNVSKGALVQLTNTLAVDHGSQFRTNAVHPTFTRGTEMTAEAEKYPGIVAAFEKAIPVGRAGTPDDIAAAICFLASTDAAFVNGAHLMVDGGLSARTAHPDFSSAL